MSGLAGGFWFNGEEYTSWLEQSLNAMRHRGPKLGNINFYKQDKGTLGLGHTHLPTINVSASVVQPMSSLNERFHLIFTGAILNYLELRAELEAQACVFETQTDIEVLINAWAQWGIKGLVKFKGMFAFAVLDNQQNTLTLVRDAFGIKPCYYHLDSGSFTFASEVSGLLPLLNSKPELNWQAAYDYLVHGSYDSTDKTLYQGVKHLPAAHYIQIDLTTGKATEPQAWWVPNIKENNDWTFEKATQAVRNTFLENIKLNLRSEVPLGAALSGGIDSSAVVCAMKHIAPDIPIKTFSYIAQGSDVNEEEWVDKVNQFAGAQAHKVTANSKELLKDIDAMIRAQGEPFGSTSIYAQFRVFQLAKENDVTVTLDGQGADEMLAGYSGYPGQRLRSLLEQGKLITAWQFLSAWSKWPGRSKMLALKYLVSELTSGALYEFLRKIDGRSVSTAEWINADALKQKGIQLEKPRIKPANNLRGRRVMDELALSLSKRGIGSLLRHGDRNSMHFSLESRVPFLTIDLVEMLLSMPEEYLISNEGETKHVFRAAMRGIVPDEVLDRKDKIGFATPEQDWLISIAPQLREWLTEDINLPFLNQQKILKEFDAVVKGEKTFTWQIWRWVNFVRWYKLNFSEE